MRQLIDEVYHAKLSYSPSDEINGETKQIMC
jgi:hypothetical protein